MSVREYIGARYVPLFIGEWSDDVSYEPLSIVVHEGNSYTSRQYVPIGISIDNTAYWAVTGNYNAQIEQYRREVGVLAESLPSTDFSSESTVKDYVDEAIGTIAQSLPSTDFSSENTVKKYIDDEVSGLDSRLDVIETNDWVTTDRIENTAVTTAKMADGSVTTVKLAEGAVTASKIADGVIGNSKIANGAITNAKTSKKKMVVIGDSFTVANNPYAEFVWADKVAEGLNCDLYNYAIGSSGFVVGRDTNISFSYQLAQAASELSTATYEVDYVFIYGGFNDWYALNNNPNPGYNLTDVVNAATSVITGAHTSFPNAKIVYIPLNFSAAYLDNTARSFLSTMCNVADLKPYVFMISNAYAPLQCFPASVVHYTDSVHPNTTGQAVLADFFLGCLMGNTNDRQTLWSVNYVNTLAVNEEPSSNLIVSPNGTRVMMNFKLQAGTYTQNSAQVLANAATYASASGKPVPLANNTYQINVGGNLAGGNQVQFKMTAQGELVMNPLETFTLAEAKRVAIDYFIKR